MVDGRSDVGAHLLLGGVFFGGFFAWVFGAPELLMRSTATGSEAVFMGVVESIAGGVIAFLLIDGLGLPAFAQLARARRCRAAVVAEVVESWLEQDEEHGRLSHHVGVALRFDLEGRPREVQLRVGPNLASEAQARELRRRWPEGRSLELRVDPEAPESLGFSGSTLKPWLTAVAAALTLLAPAWVLACGIVGLLD